MRHRTFKGVIVVGLFAGLFSPAVAAVTTESLLAEMVDLRRLTKLPDPAYTTKQFSSYDRGSKSPSQGWFANGDCGKYLRIEERAGRKEHVMMDAAGPGAIVRIWSANPKGTLRIYIDDVQKPVIEAEMAKLLGGEVAGLPKPIAGERSRGWNLYFPIPYARGCKVTSDEGGFYYHVNYRTYEKGTEVRSFTPEDLTRLADRINDIAQRLSDLRPGPEPPAMRTKNRFHMTLPPEPDKAVTLWEARGPKAIWGFLVHLEAEDLEAAARNVVLHMTFDGEQTVETPIGDFFGTAPGLTPYASLPLSINENKPQDLWCHWWMPFSRNAGITVRNFGEQTVLVHGLVAVMPYDWDDRSLLFHAKWRIERDLPTRPFSDWAHLECTGKGRFVGGALHIVNPVKNWWGEGDEKIYVDGEEFPSHFGTGTEDYYGYAWCCNERFVHAYHNQPRCDGPNNYGNTSVNRFHIIDDIPFTRSFKFDIENWHSHDRAKTTRAAVSYWYARPGGSDFFKPITKQDTRLVEIEPLKVHRVPGAIEGERMAVIEKTGTLDKQHLGDRFSGEVHLWWTRGKPGDKLTLGFDADASARKHVIVRLTRAHDYAKVQLYVNDEKAGDVIDLYHDGVIPADEIDLGSFALTKRRNTLTAEIVGANEKAVKSYMFGLDYILLK